MGLFPDLGDRGLASFHLSLELFVLNLGSKRVRKNKTHALANEPQVAKTEGDVQILAKLDKISHSQEEGAESISDHILPHEAGGSYWHRVAIDHAESFLEDSVLALCWQDLLFIVVAGQLE